MAKDFISDEEMAEIESKKSPDFISDEEMASLEAKGAVEKHPVGQFLDSAANMMTMGYAPQIETVLEGVLSPKRPLSQALPGSDAYTKRRDEIIAENERGAIDNPMADLAGKGAGIVGSMATTAEIPGLIPGLKALPTVVQAVAGGLLGVGEMAAQNPGDQPGVVDPIQFEDRKAMLADSPYMTAAAAALPAVSGLAQMSKGDKAAEMAFSALSPRKKIIKEAVRAADQSPKSKISVGRYALDEGIVGPTSTYEKMYNKSQEVLNNVGKQIKDLNVKANKKIEEYLVNNAGKDKAGVSEYLSKTFNKENWKDKILGEIEDSLQYEPGAKTAISKASDYLDDIFDSKKGSSLDVEDLQKIRTKLGKSVKDWSKSNIELPETQQAWKVIRNNVDQAIDNEFDFLESISKPNEAGNIRKMRKEYTSAKVINDSALDKISSPKGQTIEDLLTIGAGAAATTGAVSKNVPMSIGGIATAGALQGLKKARQSGIASSFKASAADQLLNQPLSKTVMGPAMGLSGLNAQMREQTIEGYPISQTQEVTPQEYLMFGSDLEKAPISNLERAKRMNLLTKHKRVYLGQ